MNLFLATTVGLLSGVVGTGLGGLLAVSVTTSDLLLSILMGFAGGLMLAVVTFDLLTTAFAFSGGLAEGLAGLLMGFLLMLFLDWRIRRLSRLGRHSHELRTGLLLALGVAMHDLAEGLAVGAGFSAATSLGLGVALVMTIHNIPEGLAIGIPLRQAHVHQGKVLTATLLTGLPMALGTVVGGLIGRISPLFLALSLGFAGGAMLCLVVEKMVPEAHTLQRRYSSTLGFALGTIAGIILCSL